VLQSGGSGASVLQCQPQEGDRATTGYDGLTFCTFNPCPDAAEPRRELRVAEISYTVARFASRISMRFNTTS
jgi:hypothetical protein